MAYMKKDKKNRGGVINFTFIPTIGKVEVNQTCREELIEASLKYYLSFH
jgi:3-dehydroquinate synthetase